MGLTVTIRITNQPEHDAIQRQNRLNAARPWNALVWKDPGSLRYRIISNAKRRYFFAVFMNRPDIMEKACRVFRRLLVRS